MRLATLADKERIEAICNDPLIRVWSAPDNAPPSDASRYLPPNGEAIVFDEGCYMANRMAPGIYAVHLNLLRSARGQRAVELTQEAIDVAFTQTDAQELIAPVPVTSPQVRWLVTALGFRRRFVWPASFLVGGVLREVVAYSMTRTTWETNHA